MSGCYIEWAESRVTEECHCKNRYEEENQVQKQSKYKKYCLDNVRDNVGEASGQRQRYEWEDEKDTGIASKPETHHIRFQVKGIKKKENVGQMDAKRFPG